MSQVPPDGESKAPCVFCGCEGKISVSSQGPCSRDGDGAVTALNLKKEGGRGRKRPHPQEEQEQKSSTTDKDWNRRNEVATLKLICHIFGLSDRFKRILKKAITPDGRSLLSDLILCSQCERLFAYIRNAEIQLQFAKEEIQKRVVSSQREREAFLKTVLPLEQNELHDRLRNALEKISNDASYANLMAKVGLKKKKNTIFDVIDKLRGELRGQRGDNSNSSSRAALKSKVAAGIGVVANRGQKLRRTECAPSTVTSVSAPGTVDLKRENDQPSGGEQADADQFCTLYYEQTGRSTNYYGEQQNISNLQQILLSQQGYFHQPASNPHDQATITGPSLMTTSAPTPATGAAISQSSLNYLCSPNNAFQQFYQQQPQVHMSGGFSIGTGPTVISMDSFGKPSSGSSDLTITPVPITSQPMAPPPPIGKATVTPMSSPPQPRSSITPWISKLMASMDTTVTSTDANQPLAGLEDAKSRNKHDLAVIMPSIITFSPSLSSKKVKNPGDKKGRVKITPRQYQKRKNSPKRSGERYKPAMVEDISDWDESDAVVVASAAKGSAPRPSRKKRTPKENVAAQCGPVPFDDPSFEYCLSYLSHLSTVHGQPYHMLSGLWGCQREECVQLRFPTAELLKWHVDNHNLLEALGFLQCPRDKGTFYSEMELVYHYVKHHDQSREKGLTEQCGHFRCNESESSKFLEKNNECYSSSSTSSSFFPLNTTVPDEGAQNEEVGQGGRVEMKEVDKPQLWDFGGENPFLTTVSKNP